MTYRRIIAVASAISAAVALYLHLWKIGATAAPLACGLGAGCVTAQMSWYGWFLGVDVALIGTGGYTAVVLVAGVGSLRRFADARWPTIALMALIWPAVLFTLRLKYGEFVVLRTFCPWCAVSAVTITLDAVLVTLDWQRVRAGDGDEAADDADDASGVGAPLAT